jgi:hypothetical protein
MYAIDTDGRLLMSDLADDKQATTDLVARSTNERMNISTIDSTANALQWRSA